MVNQWFVYLASCYDGSLYTGVTTNPQERMRRHQKGRGSAYVRSKGFTRLIYLESRAGRSDALKREAEIKSWRREKKAALITSRPYRPSLSAHAV